ncbi:MAG TPA: hypothetical protein VK116_06740, partial [Planctomycetota bacterium]|nr:hypothetical protein [Planctomycetota bacterium]
EAHIDALVLGGELALDVARRRAEEGDAGEIYAAVRVFSRERRFDLLTEVLDRVTPDAPDATSAIAEALSLELPSEWHDKAIDLLRSRDELTGLLARVVGRRRIAAASDALLDRLQHGPPESLPAIAYALGRIAEPKARGPLLHLRASSSDASFRREALVALLRLHDPSALVICREEAVGNESRSRSQAREESEEKENRPGLHLDLAAASPADHARLMLALAGGPDDPQILLRCALASATPATVLALGVLGDPAAVPTLLEYLARKETAPAAALGLSLLTGASLIEEVFIPEEIDPDTLSSDERERLERGEPPFPPDHPIPGDRMLRLAEDPVAWREWWREHRSRFEAGARYRGGEPFSAEAVVRVLARAGAHPVARRIALDELAIRYGARSPLEVELPALEQTRHVDELASWAASGRVRDARAWAFGGRPVDAR